MEPAPWLMWELGGDECAEGGGDTHKCNTASTRTNTHGCAVCTEAEKKHRKILLFFSSSNVGHYHCFADKEKPLCSTFTHPHKNIHTNACVQFIALELSLRQEWWESSMTYLASARLPSSAVTIYFFLFFGSIPRCWLCRLGGNAGTKLKWLTSALARDFKRPACMYPSPLFCHIVAKHRARKYARHLFICTIVLRVRTPWCSLDF